MASYTDIQQIPFTPYRAAIDTNAYVQVGLQKQQQYDLGVQKIQFAIDQVGGLDIANPYAKEYFKQQYDSMKSKIQQMAGSDFSNNSIVNQVQGIASTVAKDPAIQNAVVSTQKIRKGYSEIEKLRSEGKTAPENEWYYNRQVNDYVSSNDLKRSFNASYTPYVDAEKVVLDAIKQIDPDSKITQLPYETDKNGNYKYENGQPVLSTVILEKITKGKDPNKVMQVLETAMSPAVMQQLQITGAYRNQGMTPVQLANSVNRLYKSKEDVLSAEILAKNTQLVNEKDKSIRDNLTNELTFLEQSQKELLSQKNSELSRINEDPLSVGASIYINGWKNNILTGFSSRQEEINYKENPLYKAWKDQEKFLYQQQQDKFDNNLKLSKEAREQEEFRIKQVNGTLGGGKVNGTAGVPQDAPIDPDEDPTYYTDRFYEDQSKMISERNSLNVDLAINYLQSSPANKNMSKEDVRRFISKQGNDNGESFAARFAMKAQESYRNSRTGVPFELRSQFDKLTQLNDDIEINQKIIEEENQLLKSKSFQSGKLLSDDKSLISGVKEISEDGKRYSPSDIKDFALYTYYQNKFFNDKDSKKTQEAALERLQKKFGEGGLFKDGPEDAIRTINFSLGSNLSKEVQKVYDKLENNLFREELKTKEEFYRNRASEATPKNIPITRGNAEQKAKVNSDIMTYLGSLSEVAGNNNSTEDIANILNDDNSSVNINVKPPSTRSGQYEFNLNLVDKNGEITSVAIPQKIAQNITGIQFQNNYSPVKRRLDLNKNNNSTNFYNSVYHPDAWKTSMFSHKDFKNIKNYTVSADVVRNESTGDYNMILYVKDNKPNGEYERISIPDNYSLEQVQQIPTSLSEAQLKAIIELERIN